MAATLLFTHGTYTAYATRGCRCNRCRAAKADYTRTLRASRAGLRRDDPRHGTRNAYDNFRCRCTRCIDAHERARMEYYYRRLLAPGETP